MMRYLFLGLVLALALVVHQQEEVVTGPGAKRVEKIKQFVNEAGAYYVDKEYQFAANKISAAQKLLVRSIAEGEARFKEVLMKEHGRIAKAHELLSAQGQQLDSLAPFPEDFGENPPVDSEMSEEDSGQESGASESQGISFKKSVEPLLVKHCGSCHIRGTKGQYSMSTFEKLMGQAPGGDSVVAGEPDDSLIFQLMDSGDMPPRKAVPEKDLATIKTWIEEGALFDGEDETATLGSGRGRSR